MRLSATRSRTLPIRAAANLDGCDVSVSGNNIFRRQGNAQVGKERQVLKDSATIGERSSSPRIEVEKEIRAASSLQGPGLAYAFFAGTLPLVLLVGRVLDRNCRLPKVQNGILFAGGSSGPWSRLEDLRKGSKIGGDDQRD